MKKNKEKETAKKAENEEILNAKETNTTKPINEKETEDEEKKEETSKEIDYKQKFEEMNDKYLRLYSDFDNFRKRTNKEKLNLRKIASADVVVELLPVVDDFERAIQSLEGAKDVGAVLEGINLVLNKFKNVLNQQGVEEMKTVGEKFDADLHEAITNIPAESDDKKGTIIDETQKGYTMNGKVIRFPKVVVAN